MPSIPGWCGRFMQLLPGGKRKSADTSLELQNVRRAEKDRITASHDGSEVDQPSLLSKSTTELEEIESDSQAIDEYGNDEAERRAEKDHTTASHDGSEVDQPSWLSKSTTELEEVESEAIDEYGNYEAERAKQELRAQQEENRKLQDKTNVLERRIEELEYENCELQSSCRKEETEKEMLHYKVQSLTDEVNRFQADVDSKEKEDRRLKRRLVSLECELDDTQNLLQECRENYDMVLKRFHSLKSEHRDLELEEMASGEQLRKDVQALEAYKQWATPHIDSIGAQNKEYLKKIENLRTENNTSVQKLQRCEREKRAAEEARQSSESQLAELKSQLSELRNTAEEKLQNMRERHQRDMQRIKEQYDQRLRHLQSERSRDIRRLESQLANFFQVLASDGYSNFPKIREAVKRTPGLDKAVRELLLSALGSRRQNSSYGKRCRIAEDVEELTVEKKPLTSPSHENGTMD